MKDGIIFTLMLPHHVPHLLTCIPDNLLRSSSKACNNRCGIQGLLIQTGCCSRLFVLTGFYTIQVFRNMNGFGNMGLCLGEPCFEEQFPTPPPFHIYFSSVYIRGSLSKTISSSLASPLPPCFAARRLGRS